MVSSMAIPEGHCYLHPGISVGLSASPAESHSGVSVRLSANPAESYPDTPRVSSLRQAIPHSRHSSTLSKTLGLSRHSSLLTRERPNTDGPFSVSVSNEPLLPSVANILHADGIAKLLKTYPNQRFVDTLTSTAPCGTRIGFEGIPSGHVQRPNHSSAFAHPEIITQSIQNELQKGRVKQISSLP